MNEILENKSDIDTDDREDKSISIPIKGIIEDAIRKSHSHYLEEFIFLLRGYFIALLNLGYIIPNELEHIVTVLVTKVNEITFGLGSDKKKYEITDKTLRINFKYINCKFHDDEPLSKEYNIVFYGAVTYVIFDCIKSDLQGIADIVCHLIGERVYTIHNEERRVIFPKTKVETIFAGKKIETRTGYVDKNIEAGLFKQCCMTYDVNENNIFSQMFLSGFDKTLEKLSVDMLRTFGVLDKYIIIRKNKNSYFNSFDYEFIEQFQLELASNFKKVTPTFLAFLALAISEEIRKKITETVEF